MTLVKIIGGHGKVAMLIAQQLVHIPQTTVESYIRNPDQADDIAKTGATPVVFDVVQATPADLKKELQPAQFVIWAAGAGGKSPPGTAYKVDRDGTIAVCDALKQSTNLKRFIIVSAIGTEFASQFDESFPLYHYYRAKAAADEYVASSSVPYTILGPGWLSDKPGSGKVQVDIPRAEADPRQPNPKQISRSNVASAVKTLITSKAALEAQLNKTVEILDGDIPIGEALSK